MRLIKAFFIALIISTVISLTLVGIFYRIIEGTEIKKDTFMLNNSPTIVYDNNGKTMAKFFSERREIAKYNETPQEIVDAVISTEDRDFFKHAGINVKAISRALVAIVKADGELVQGGSTLTQQLIKNTHLTSKKTFERKFDEMVYATELEKQFTKQEIFEMYINDVEFLWRAYGFRDALMTYFGNSFDQFEKLPREDRIAKSALLAALLKSPTQYDPFRHPDVALKRRNVVIKNMKTTNKITEEEYQKAIKKPLLILSKPNMVFEEEKIRYQELVEYALTETSKKMDISVKDVMNGGFKIYTSFNTDVYKIIRQEYSKSSNFPANAVDGTKVESSTVFINPKNGELIAFTGGREEPKPEEFLGFNRAYRLKKQPGSTIKPVVAYGPALESGKFTPNSSLLDEKGHVFPGGYVVKDWDKGGRGSVTMKEALRQSWNIPAVWTLQQVGLDYAKNYVQKLGLDLSEEKTLGIALGGLEGGVSPLEMADSYQAFANKGIRTPAHSIRMVRDNNNNIVLKTSIESQPVIKPKNANDIKEMLRNAVANGTAKKGQIQGRQIAGKTGTVQHPLIPGKVNSDVWFVGFDEQIVSSMWMGFDTISKQRYLNVSSGYAAEFWSRLGEKVLHYYSLHGGLDTPSSTKSSTASDNYAPRIKLNGRQTMTLIEGETYEEEGATAKDAKDGDLTNKIKIFGTVNTNKPGTYKLTYTVSDKSYNVSTIKRTVIVNPKPQPVISMNLNAEAYESDNAFYISWDAISGSPTYKLFKNGQLLQKLDTNSYFDGSINSGVEYEYKVYAYDKETGQKIGESTPKAVEINENNNTTGYTNGNNQEEVNDEENNELDNTSNSGNMIESSNEESLIP
ncbi:transglycosylase domain-containing protein [Priestia filamentosa]|uniref:transglycosylase domain-containing protein n=1 Tax=Priestia filamentosa TaxID=1402861 RepID=UPI00397802F5